MTQAKQRQLARELDTRVRYLRLTGMDGMTLFAAMSDRLPDFKALLDAAGPSGMDTFAGRLLDLRRYAELVAGMARGIPSNNRSSIKAPE